MSYIEDESAEKWLSTNEPEQVNGPLYYKERAHVRSFLRKLVRPALLLFVPIAAAVWLEHVGGIIGHWIETTPAFVPEHLLYARTRIEDFFAPVAQMSWIWQLIQVTWFIVISFLTVKAYYDWSHEFRSISKEYVISAEKRLLHDEDSVTIETSVVVGVKVTRTLFDKLFPKCGSIVVKTKDFEGDEKSVQFQDVKDPYRMRDVILHVRKLVRTEENGR